MATTSVSIDIIHNSWDKLNHFIAFLILYILFSFAYSKLTMYKKSMLLIIYAIQIEIVQYFIPDRYFSFEDIFADIIGIILGVIIHKYLKQL